MSGFIFCPLCGQQEWLTTKTSLNKQPIVTWLCSDCRDFSYLSHENGKLFSVGADVSKYRVVVYYDKPATLIFNKHKDKLLLKIDLSIDFDWYDPDKLIDKLKKYIVFS